jgi:hypothetical protein
MKEKCSYRIVESAKNPLSPAVLCRGVGAGEAQQDAMCC